MTMIPFPKDLGQVSERALLPKGKYLVKVTKVSNQLSAAGNQMTILELTVQDGEYVGRKASHFLVYSTDDVNLGRVKNTLRSFLGITTGMSYDDNELLNRDAIATVGISPARDGYDESNSFRFTPVNTVSGG